MSLRFRRGVLLRLILNGIILLVISAAGFLGLASVLLGDQAKQAERTMTDWFAREACEAYAKTPVEGALAVYPVSVSVYSSSGKRLAGSTPEPVVTPKACPDGSGRLVAVGGPLQRPPLSRLAVSVAAIVLIVALGSIPLARSFVEPLRELVATTARIGEGDLAARARIERSDEIGDLAVAVNAMAAKLEARLLAEKEMLANVSHELRTPLARVRVVLEMATEEPARAAALLTEVSRDLTELERLTDDVLTTLRLDFAGDDGKAAPGLRLRAADVELTTVLRHVVTRAVEAHPEREFVLDAAASIGPLRGDAALLRRLFDNLLDNARKYSSGVIFVRARDEGNAVVVEVEDRGIGIERADLERIFEPFFRTDRSRQRVSGGTGLGLALCRRIAELHRGSISATSEGGTTVVTVRLARAVV
jgi:signal transduction histidine kinase